MLIINCLFVYYLFDGPAGAIVAIATATGPRCIDITAGRNALETAAPMTNGANAPAQTPSAAIQALK
jgi:hypothetical protein